MINEEAEHALAHDRTIDITTVGRRSGQPRRIEIWFHNLDGRIYISGQPGRRDWYANVRARPEFTFHLKESAQVDIPARAHPVTNPAERGRVLRTLLQRLGRQDSFEDWFERSPLVEVEFLGG